MEGIFVNVDHIKIPQNGTYVKIGLIHENRGPRVEKKITESFENFLKFSIFYKVVPLLFFEKIDFFTEKSFH